MIALILGGSPAVWTDLAAAREIVGPRHIVVAANLAGIHYRGHLTGWGTLHPDLMGGWRAQRKGNADYRAFSAAPHGRSGGVEVVAERWPGSSGLYACQIALDVLGASGAVLCGIPMDQAAGHFITPGLWAPTTSYRLAFEAAHRAIGHHIRSMGGWTEALFGRPTPDWTATTSRALRPIKPRIDPMHTVKNTSETTQRFFAMDDQGRQQLVRLGPGESADVTIDPAQPRFAKGGAYKVTAKAGAVPVSVAQRPAPDAS